MIKNSQSIKDREWEKFSILNGRRVVRTTMPSIKTTHYGEMLTVRRNVLFELKANVPSVSQLRNNIVTTGSAAVVIENGEYKLSAPINSKITFNSGERGRYKPGYEAQAGIGIRLPDQEFLGDSYFEWGYFQGSDGFGFGKDSSGVYIFIKKNTEKEKIRQANWNIDPMNGLGPSGTTLDLSDGLIFQIDYSWYGYGAINFNILVKSENPEIGDYEQIVHRIAPKGETSISQPNLYVAAELNNDSQSELTAFVGGRQYSVFAEYNPQFRIASAFRINQSVTTAWAPVISFRRKSETLSQEAQSVKIRSVSMAAQDSIVFGYIFDGVLTGGTFTTPSNMTPSETTLEANVGATAITGGISIGPKLIAVGGQANNSSLTGDSDFTFDLIGVKNVTLVARSLSGTATISAATMNMTEEW